MLRANLVAPYEIHLEEVEKPVINDDQVLLKIHAVGICASDMQMYHGLHKYMTFPVVFGHEVGASVEQVGANVKDYKVGDLVTVEPQVTCGECYPCQIGRFKHMKHGRNSPHTKTCTIIVHSVAPSQPVGLAFGSRPCQLRLVVHIGSAQVAGRVGARFGLRPGGGHADRERGTKCQQHTFCFHLVCFLIRRCYC